MAETHVISGLISKRAELAGKIEALQDELRSLVIDLDHIDASIHIFDPSIELAEIRKRPVPPRHAANKGDVTRIVLTTLRNAKKPLTTTDVAMRVMAERGLDTANAQLVRLMQKRAGACLRHWATRGSVARERGPGKFMLWRVV